jgi:hypothetical protein
VEGVVNPILTRAYEASSAEPPPPEEGDADESKE